MRQELKKKNRRALMALVEQLQEENEQLRAQLEQRQIRIDNAGSLAEAAVRLNSVMETAQAAADQYLLNIRAMEQAQKEACIQMEKESREKCRRMESLARRQADAYVQKVYDRLKEYTDTYDWKLVLPPYIDPPTEE